MFGLGFLNGIDFSGLGALGDVSQSALVGDATQYLGPVLTPDALSGVIALIASKYTAINGQTNADVAAQLESDVQWYIVQQMPQVAAEKLWGGKVTDAFNALKAAWVSKNIGFVVKGTQPAQSTPAASGGSASPSAPPSTGGGFWSQVANAGPTTAAAISRQTSPQNRLITRTRQQTPAEKKKMYWILGIGGALFAVAIVALAVSD